MRARLVGGLLALVVAACGCGEGRSRHDDVARFIVRVNVIETALERPATILAGATRQLAKPRTNQKLVAARLRRATRQIEDVRRRLAGVTAPAEARRLHALLLELARRQATLAREEAQLAAFLPAFATALAPLAEAGDELRAELAAKSPLAAKAQAFVVYADTIETALKRLRRVHPPPVARPGYESEVKALTSVRAGAAAIATALRQKRVAAIGGLLRRFERAALSTQSLPAQRERIRALRVYNARVHGLETLLVRIAAERTRLQRTIG